jgi:hypothetical protein
MNAADNIKITNQMSHNSLHNYIVPGLRSDLVGGGEYGKVRKFVALRGALDFVTPHSHRFDFTALVLRGRVRNTIYVQGNETDSDQWCRSTIDQVCGKDGIQEYNHVRYASPTWYRQQTQTYEAGDTYSMAYSDIHSIQFDKDSIVLFFEGPVKTTSSTMIEPWVDGKVLKTFKTEDWMFSRDA